MDILDIKIKKEKLKEIAKKSVLFSVSKEALEDFIKAVDLVSEDEKGSEELDSLFQMFQSEKDTLINTYKDLLSAE